MNQANNGRMITRRMAQEQGIMLNNGKYVYVQEQYNQQQYQMNKKAVQNGPLTGRLNASMIMSPSATICSNIYMKLIGELHNPTSRCVHSDLRHYSHLQLL
jgi:hypothetical protein